MFSFWFKVQKFDLISVSKVSILLSEYFILEGDVTVCVLKLVFLEILKNMVYKVNNIYMAKLVA